MTSTTDTSTPDTSTPDDRQPEEVDVEPQHDDLDEGQTPKDGEEGQQRDPAVVREQRLRARAREAETERDVLRARVDRSDTAEVERLAAEIVLDPADLMLTTTLTELRDPTTGEVDPERVRTAAEAAVADRPHWDRREADAAHLQRMLRGRARPAGGSRLSGAGSSTDAAWAQAITPRGKRATE